MRIIAPYQISSEILNLINQSKKYIVLVSPYVDFKNWGRIVQEIEKAKDRGVKIEFITRYDVNNSRSWEQIEALGIEPKLVKNLHAKLYYNEQKGIVTSMNLLTSSNLNAIEFGAIYDAVDELKELKFFVKQFLVPHIETELPSDEDLYLSKEKFIVVLGNALSDMLNKYVKCRWNDGYISISANNQFTLEIDKVKRNVFISGIISTDENNKSNLFIDEYRKHFKFFEVFSESPKDRLSSMVAISKKSFTSDNFNHLKVKEKKEILDATCGFVDILLNFKDEVYQQR